MGGEFERQVGPQRHWEESVCVCGGTSGPDLCLPLGAVLVWAQGGSRRMQERAGQGRGGVELGSGCVLGARLTALTGGLAVG